MLAKYLVPNLAPLTKNCYTVHSSFRFAKEIVDINASGLHMASFDVDSLFTNIPLQETINIIISEIFDNPEFCELLVDSENGEKLFECHMPDRETEMAYFNRKQFRKLLEMATLDNYFFFDNSIFQQIDGVAMGSPLGPHLANIFMNFMEKKWLQDCPSSFKPVLYRRYVDDTFLLFKSDSHSSQFLTFLNSKHANIKFTCDLEQNLILPFLDVKVKRNDTKFETSIYRKPTFTGLLSKFYAFTPQQNKENLIFTLTVRAFRICSNYFLLDKELNFLKSTLQSNGYPLKFIELSIGKMLKKLYKPYDFKEILQFNVPKAKVYFSTFYLGDLSKQISSELKQIVSQYYPQVQLLVIHKTHSTIGATFGFKDKQPLMNRSNLIYRYTCECCKAFYIGKTEVRLAQRVAEHRGISARTGKSFSIPPKSDIYKHCQECHTLPSPENFTIEDTLQSSNGLLILESLHQKTKKPFIGKQQQSTPLMSFD